MRAAAAVLILVCGTGCVTALYVPGNHLDTPEMRGTPALGRLELGTQAGQIVYNPTGIGLPLWEQAPEAYWRIPKLQP